MIPTVIDEDKEIQTFEIKTDASMPTLTHRIDLKYHRVQNRIDGQEAMRQVIFKILQTERYQHYKVYSDNYGVEFITLIGMPLAFVVAEVERRIREALLWDERILTVKNFTFEKNKGNLLVKFQCDTIFGQVTVDDFEVNF